MLAGGWFTLNPAGLLRTQNKYLHNLITLLLASDRGENIEPTHANESQIGKAVFQSSVVGYTDPFLKNVHHRGKSS